MSAITITMNLNNDKTSRICHIDIHYHITQEALINSTLKLRYIQIINMIINILMKILSRETHCYHMKMMGLGWQ